MKSHLVLVEREDKVQNTVLACSGLMLNDDYVIITANILFDQWPQTVLQELQPGKLTTNFPESDISLNVVSKQEKLYTVRKAKILSAFISDNIKNSNKYVFQNWAIDSIDNNRNISEVMSLFFVLVLREGAGIEGFKKVLKEWWNLVITLDVNKGTTIYTRSVPFANRNFMDSVSKGIVSNIFGNSSCLILSDCPCTPGGEGSPVYLCDSSHNPSNEKVPIGLVLSSISWWRGEWVGLTLMADIKPIILELVDIPVRMFDTIRSLEKPRVIASLECCLVQIYSGKRWGTAVLLSEEKGIFITNSHVVGDAKVSLFHKGQSCDAHSIYRTPQGEVFDLALVKSDPTDILERFQLKSVSISRKNHKSGDTVYSAGYSLFPRECNPSPTLSKGCISQINPSMIKTTCCVHPGSSGGAVLDQDGALLGIIVCNAKLENNNMVYPRVNMAIPFLAIYKTVSDFIEREDPTILNNLHLKNKEAEIIWKRIEGKL
ncbi:peroxisomal leader peptide-processing protease isoform X2 [Anoplophora glabripennis]|uniref:peroxisomal leader peptide-processing protease isoform X2 n=1 Tax=Anoplophora glabripennis TaxID=217634 RepID=UPI0008735AC7|nr:peroxisomal leader peptide-processing protease isoform X2 [Anoplophora glabripennis]